MFSLLQVKNITKTRENLIFVKKQWIFKKIEHFEDFENFFVEGKNIFRKCARAKTLVLIVLTTLPKGFFMKLKLKNLKK